MSAGLRRQSVRTAVLVVGSGLLAGAALLLVLLQSALVSSVENEVTGRSADLAAVMSTEGLNAAAAAVRLDPTRNEVAQILGTDGRVVACSEPQLTVPLSPARPAPGSAVLDRLDELPLVQDDDDHLVAARGVAVDGRSYVVQVAAPVQVQTDTLRVVGLFVVAAVPLILGLVGLAVWILVGRSLQAVERIRRQVSAIDHERLGDRVDVPPTGDEVALLASTMNTMLDRLQTSDQALRAFLSDASHELRSPLSTLITATEVASLDPTGDRWADLQPLVRTESERMQSLVEGLLTLAKADAHTLVIAQDEVDLDDVLDREVRRLRVLTDLTLTVRIDPVRVRGDEGRLTQVVRNLLDNAVRHARSTVALSTGSDGDRVRIDVDNDGPVIGDADRTRVFERFTRLEESRDRDAGGSGLGLAISAEIVALHHGSIQVTATERGWCRFTVSLPRLD